ncbi:MAG: glycosyltransferase [Anaerolineales bacterium]|nr:glycosyltransferase [Anaerolineales bacterium]
MDKKPLVSIVTPSFNQQQYLEQTIQSVLDQAYPALEYFVVDGGSKDGSIEIIKKYQDQLSGWISEPDQGQTDAINKGFARSQGEIMAWLNSDDIYLPGAIRSAVAFLQDNPEVGMVYGDTNLIDGTGRKIGDFNARQTSYQRLMRGGVYIPQPAAFWRRELWNKSGPLDPAYYFAMDYDLWVRFAKIARIQYTPQLWASFRIHGEGKTTLSDKRCWPEMRKVYQREGGGVISLFVAKYILRMSLGSTWNWIKMKRLKI